MGNNKKTENKSRRWFLSGGLLDSDTGNKKVKMLTADGNLVEIDKNIFDAAAAKKKVSNKEILEWMKNPSKDNG